MNGKIWLDGTFVDGAAGTIPLGASALHYGTAVFEGILCVAAGRGGGIFRAADHIDRLFASAAAVGMPVPCSRQEIIAAVAGLVQVNGWGSCYLRPIVFDSGDYLSLRRHPGPVRVAVVGARFNPFMFRAHMLFRKSTALVSPTPTLPGNPQLGRVKASGRYLSSVTALRQARAAGHDDVIFTDHAGCVIEATSSNVCLVARGELVLPASPYAIAGITQDTIATLAREAGYPVTVREVSREELFTADEVFLTGTARGIVPVSRLDGKRLTDATGAGLTKRLREAYLAVIAGRDARHASWIRSGGAA